VKTMAGAFRICTRHETPDCTSWYSGHDSFCHCALAHRFRIFLASRVRLPGLLVTTEGATGYRLPLLKAECDTHHIRSFDAVPVRSV
jgi:hypothetical protein